MFWRSWPNKVKPTLVWSYDNVKQQEHAHLQRFLNFPMNIAVVHAKRKKTKKDFIDEDSDNSSTHFSQVQRNEPTDLDDYVRDIAIRYQFLVSTIQSTKSDWWKLKYYLFFLINETLSQLLQSRSLNLSRSSLTAFCCSNFCTSCQIQQPCLSRQILVVN